MGTFGWVCLSCFNSPLDCFFVPQTTSSTARVTTISLIEPFFLNMLRCRDLSAATIVRIQTVGHFTLRQTRMRIISTTWWKSVGEEDVLKFRVSESCAEGSAL